MIAAHTLAALCADSYHAPPHIQRAGLHIVLTPAPASRTIIAAFRGSADLDDWVLNLRQTDIRSVKYPKLDAMPEGFADDILDAYTEISKALEGYERIVLTGHSRGGGQAQITGALLESDGVHVDQIETFGAPRMHRLGGMIAKTQGFDWLNGNDPVPTLPFWSAPARWAFRLCGPKRELAPACVADHYIAAYQANLPK